VADSNNHRIQKFDSNGTFLAKWGSEGSGDGQFNWPAGVWVDNSGNVYVADYNNHRIQKFDTYGAFLAKWGSEGGGDGEFKNPTGVWVDDSGNVYVAERGNHRIQKFDPNGTFLAKWGSQGSGDGQFDGPVGVAVDSSGNVYVTDTGNSRIQKFSPADLPAVAVTMSEDSSPISFRLILTARDPDGDTLTWSIQSPASHGVASASGTGATKAIGYTPAADYHGIDSFIVEVEDGHGGQDTITVNVTVQPDGKLYLPFIGKAASPGCDLVIDEVNAGSGGITVKIRNQGRTAVTDSFWLDVYFNPSQTPVVNRPWDTIAPAGAVWGVTRALNPGESLTLTSGGAYYSASHSSASFPAGAQLYALVDSINFSTTYGNVREDNESNNLFGPVVSTAGSQAQAAGESEPAPAGLPKR
jgi:hypothetical protein